MTVRGETCFPGRGSGPARQTLGRLGDPRSLAEVGVVLLLERATKVEGREERRRHRSRAPGCSRKRERGGWASRDGAARWATACCLPPLSACLLLLRAGLLIEVESAADFVPGLLLPVSRFSAGGGRKDRPRRPASPKAGHGSRVALKRDERTAARRPHAARRRGKRREANGWCTHAIKPVPPDAPRLKTAVSCCERDQLDRRRPYLAGSARGGRRSCSGDDRRLQATAGSSGTATAASTLPRSTRSSQLPPLDPAGGGCRPAVLRGGGGGAEKKSKAQPGGWASARVPTPPSAQQRIKGSLGGGLGGALLGARTRRSARAGLLVAVRKLADTARARTGPGGERYLRSGGAARASIKTAHEGDAATGAKDSTSPTGITCSPMIDISQGAGVVVYIREAAM